MARMGYEKCIQNFIAGKHKGKGPHGRRKRRLADNIKMELKEEGFEDVD